MLFRSEKVHYYELVMPYDSGWTVMNSIGSLDAVQVVDMNNETHLLETNFGSYLKRCDYMLWQVAEFAKISEQYEVEYKKCGDIPGFMKRLEEVIYIKGKSGDVYFNDLETSVKRLHDPLVTHTKMVQQLNEKVIFQKENLQVLKQIKPHIPQEFTLYCNVGNGDPEESVSSVRFCYVVGTIATSLVQRFERISFRMTRGNAFLNVIDIELEEAKNGQYKDVELDENEKPIKKSIFFLVFQLGGSNLLKDKIVKLCQAFGCRMYDLPETYNEFDKEIEALELELNQMLLVRKETEDQIKGALLDAAKFHGDSDFSYLNELKMKILRERHIYEQLNRMKLKDNIFYAKLWIPRDYEAIVKETLTSLEGKQNFTKADLTFRDYKQTGMMPPTYFKTNEFTAVFQEIVNIYGFARYREVNPGLFTIITFPFLFGVMFGDLGHGGVMFLFGIFLVLRNRALKGTALEGLSPYRFFFLLCGFFAFYCGLIYNEFFSIPLRLFESCYEYETLERINETCVYPVGMDPAFFETEIDISYMNSLKMKLSILIGVIHMTFGIILGGFNAIHFGDYVDVIFKVIPEVIFFLVTFGYMCYAIVIKWLTNWNTASYPPPSIINIYTSAGIATPTTRLWGDSEGVQQTNFQILMFEIAGILVPWMLFPRPIIKYFAMKRKHNKHKKEAHNEEGNELKEGLNQDIEITDEFANDPSHGHSASGHGEDEGFSDIFIHQLIEVIEFVLGAVSNTASYLRLWALSLAHGQLAKVFLNMTIMGGVYSESVIAIFVGYPIWLGATIGVLMLMDVMECCLHDVRLHWVEFQSKFYKGDGHPYLPVSFNTYLSENRDVIVEKPPEKQN